MHAKQLRGLRQKIGIRTGVVVALVAVGLLAAPAIASANNDPHRIFTPTPSGFLPAATSTTPGYCPFDVTYTTLVSNQYSTFTTEPDGSTVVKTTGSLFMLYTNDSTGKSITVNLSGPGTAVVPASGTVITADSSGLAGFSFTNATAFGFPSNLVVTTGLLEFAFDYSNQTIVSMTRAPHVLLDVCAALS